MTLKTYKLLGGSGLRVSPMSLGTMTFGTDGGWGADIGEASRILDLYLDRGGNFIDTAVNYTNGTLGQAEYYLVALEAVLSPEQLARLNRVSEPHPIFPARFVQRPLVQQLIHGGAAVARRA